MALTDCLIRVGDGLVQPDRKTLVDSAQTYMKEGMSQADAERRAVRDLLDVYETEKRSIEKQIADQYGAGKPQPEPAKPKQDAASKPDEQVSQEKNAYSDAPDGEVAPAQKAADSAEPADAKAAAMRKELDDLVAKFDSQKRINSSELAHATHLARELRLIDHWTDLAIKSPYNTQKQGADLLSAKVKARPGAGTLSANPFADPAVWAQAAKDAGHALKTLVQALRDVSGWDEPQAKGWVKWTKDFAKSVADLHGLGGPQRRERADALGNVVIRMYRAVMESAGTDMLGIAKRSGSQTMQDVVRKFAHLSGDMSGQSETVSQRVEYEWARRAAPVSKALDAAEKMAKDAGRDVGEVMAQVANLVRNPRGIRAGTPVHDAAIAIRKALDEAHQYMRDAGMEVGHVKDYYPREFDMDAVRSRPVKELEDALVQAYRETGLDDKSAREAASSLADKLIFGRDSLFDRGIGKPEGDFIKSRVFGPAVDNPKHPLHKFLVHDPRQSVASYLQRAVRRAELVRVVGDGPEKWQELRAKMIEEGVTPDAMERLQDFIQTVGGMVGDKGLNRSILSAVSTMRTMGTLMFLEKATLTSLSEIIMPAIRSGNVIDLHRSVATTVKSLFMKDRPDVKELTALAEDIGMLTNGIGSAMLMNRWHGGDFANKWQTAVMDAHFRMTGLAQYTEATRRAALEVGRVFMRRMVMQDGKLASDMLGEMGIPKDKQEAFTSWLTKTNDGMPTLEDMQKAPKEMRDLYYTAMRKFESDSIMRPNQTTRPGWMNKPVLGLLGQLLSYSYAFYNHVLKRNVKNTARAFTEADYTMMERAKLAGPLLMMPMLAAIQGLVGEVRDALFADPDRELETWQKITRAFSRGIPVAPIDPWLNVFAGAKFQRSATETLSGPVLGIAGRGIDAYADFIMKNSEGTNTQERALQKAIYDIVLEPSGAMVLSHAFAVTGGLPGQLALAAGRQALGSGQVRDMYVGGIAGEAEKKRRSTDNSGSDSGFKDGFDSGSF